ncbi:MAG: cell division protein FtsZ, partial [Verrucomicrobiota bacterium]|nr:cell division protein FtsZ [Verrucomicrobiota bacterium]
MIEISRNHHASHDADIRIKILGLGGAGSNALDRIMLDGLECAELVAINTDVQSLTSSVASHKVQLGRGTTRGLGAGGDPEVGYEAAQEGADEIRDALEDAQLIFLCVGLGGGTGSGAAPLVAHLAREQGALVIVVATVPFS